MSVIRRRLKKSPQAGDLAHLECGGTFRHTVAITAPDFHRLPHQFPAPAKGFLKRVGSHRRAGVKMQSASSARQMRQKS